MKISFWLAGIVEKWGKTQVQKISSNFRAAGVIEIQRH
jgi:hypothetical protein